MVHGRRVAPVLLALVLAAGCGGTAMVALSELVGLPALVLLLVQWVRSDAGEASVIDETLDQEVAASDAPWWEVDPGPLGDRFRR